MVIFRDEPFIPYYGDAMYQLYILNSYRSLAFIKTTAIGLSLICAFNLSGCDLIIQDPYQQAIPTNSETWQDELADTLQALPESDRKLVSRYMLRMKLSKAYEAGAMERVTIAKAIKLQQEYERLHPNNPTGKNSPVILSTTKFTLDQTYPITLLPIKIASQETDNAVTFRFILSNFGQQPISSFMGTLLLQSPDFAKGTSINIPIKSFEPAIRVDDVGKIKVDVTLDDVNVMRAIKDANAVRVTITQGEIVLSDGSIVRFNDTQATP